MWLLLDFIIAHEVALKVVACRQWVFIPYLTPFAVIIVQFAFFIGFIINIELLQSDIALVESVEDEIFGFHGLIVKKHIFNLVTVFFTDSFFIELIAAVVVRRINKTLQNGV